MLENNFILKWEVEAFFNNGLNGRKERNPFSFSGFFFFLFNFKGNCLTSFFLSNFIGLSRGGFYRRELLPIAFPEDSERSFFLFETNMLLYWRVAVV
jgi:hypothetical protein